MQIGVAYWLAARIPKLKKVRDAYASAKPFFFSVSLKTYAVSPYFYEVIIGLNMIKQHQAKPLFRRAQVGLGVSPVAVALLAGCGGSDSRSSSLSAQTGATKTPNILLIRRRPGPISWQP